MTLPGIESPLPARQGGYRRDIDGLRAIAVLLVVLFHLGLGIPGGYIGVDVFFVISGFLITGIVSRELKADDFSIFRFYERRARRILPALYAVLIFTSVAAVWILLPTDLERYGKSLIASLLSISNLWFWSQGGYFGSASAMAPLLHTWSLGVEEQFYVFLPVGLMVLYRWTPRHVPTLLAIATLGSFAASAVFIAARTPEVFYLTPFRAWELSLGGLLAVTSLPCVVKEFHRSCIAAAGLMLIVVPAFVFNEETLFPGPLAALPCSGVALVIWVGMSGDSSVKRLLATPALVHIGMVSYSLYLWHWPLLVLARHANTEQLSLVWRLLIGVAAMAMAVLSWRYIEQPFRGASRLGTRKALTLAGALTTVLIAVAVVVIHSGGLQSRFEPEVVALDQDRIRHVVRPECIDYRVPLIKRSVCRIGAPGNPTILVWGDSHAHAMLPAFQSAFEHLGLSAYFIAESGCPPLPGTSISLRGRDNWRCGESVRNVQRFAASERRVQTFILVAAWDAYLAPDGGYFLRGDANESPEAATFRSLLRFGDHVGSNKGFMRLVVVGQVPSHAASVPTQMLNSRRKLVRPAVLSESAWDEESRVSRETFANLSASGKIRFIDPQKWFCAGGTCKAATEDGRPMYWDKGHLNMRGASFITSPLTLELRRTIANASTQIH